MYLAGWPQIAISQPEPGYAGPSTGGYQTPQLANTFLKDRYIRIGNGLSALG